MLVAFSDFSELQRAPRANVLRAENVRSTLANRKDLENLVEDKGNGQAVEPCS